MNSKSEITEKKRRLTEKLVFELPVLRARLGVSQAEIAEKIGISRQSFNAIETGKKEMNWTTFVALVMIFRNNEQTRQMIDGIAGFEEYIGKLLEL